MYMYIMFVYAILKMCIIAYSGSLYESVNVIRKNDLIHKGALGG